MMPTPPLGLRNRLAETILSALGDPGARRELAELAGPSRTEELAWLRDVQPEHAAIVRERARRASEALATLPLLTLEPSPAGCRSISRSAPAPPGRDGRWGVWGAMSGPPMSLEHALLGAAALFDAGLHFEVHEVLEPHWTRSAGAARQALQGLIQVAVGFQHLANGNLEGARALLAEGGMRLRDGRLAGLDLDRFAEGVAGAASQLTDPGHVAVPRFPRTA